LAKLISTDLLSIDPRINSFFSMLVGVVGATADREGTEKGDVMGEMGPTRQQVAEVATGLVVVMREMEDLGPQAHLEVLVAQCEFGWIRMTPISSCSFDLM
jgi:hypothetical protein